MRAVALVMTLSACGRFAFAPEGDAAAPIVPDTTVTATCGGAAFTPPIASISGSTFHFSSFNTTSPLADVAITIADRSSGATLAMTTSDANGAYSDSFATNSAALDVVVTASAMGFMTTYSYLDTTIGSSVTFDSPLWDSNGMDIVYGTVGASRDPNAGTLNVGVFHCDGSPFEGVVVAVDPPAQVQYIDSNGAPSMTLGSTVAPYGFAVVLNAVGGVNTVTATTPGVSFTAQIVNVEIGESAMRLAIYGGE